MITAHMLFYMYRRIVIQPPHVLPKAVGNLLIAAAGPGMHLARNRVDPGCRQRGTAGGPRLIAFTSEQAHYSYLKCATLTGLGSDNLISVACDESGAICPDGVGSLTPAW